MKVLELPAIVRKTIEKHQLVVPGEPILAGVSGGADSVCLALVLKELGFSIGIAHVNHGLRGEDSDADERFTAALAQRLSVRYFSRRVLLMAGNLEAAGRDARRDFFSEIAEQNRFSKIALAHTRNDRVETFLLNLLRGAGPDGLVSMAAMSGRIIRPLIDVGRETVEAYLQQKKQAWRNDESNLDLTFARNYLRHEVIPNLAEAFNPNLVDTLSRTVEVLETEDAWLRWLTDDWIAKNGINEDEDFVIPVKALHSGPAGLVRRVVRAALRRAGSDMQNVSFEHIENVRLLLESGKSGKMAEIPGGFQVLREFDRLVFRQAQVPASEYEYQLKIPGLVHIPELGKMFRAELVESETGQTAGQRVFVDAESLGAYVRIRNWKPGDYYRPVGLPAGKLKKLFQRARIPRSHRMRWPVVVADSTIIWVASFPVSREFAPRGRSQKIVALEASEI
ncbi:MAG TPA: tRNA lysidine(34) synthetase TilS [Terriglobia bacterium]|jgi:tRNA(Ile)-lysidine synthase